MELVFVELNLNVKNGFRSTFLEKYIQDMSFKFE